MSWFSTRNRILYLEKQVIELDLEIKWEAHNSRVTKLTSGIRAVRSSSDYCSTTPTTSDGGATTALIVAGMVLSSSSDSSSSYDSSSSSCGGGD